LTGATGFIGTALVRALRGRGEDCTVLARSGSDPWPGLGVRVIRANPAVAGRWELEVDGMDAVINLAGERIVDPPHRWTDARKQALRSSRVDTTRNIVTAIRAARTPPRVLVSGSAVGYYGARGDAVVDESEPAGNDFLARLCVEWESEARGAESRCRVVTLRSGMVLGPGGGGLAPLMWLFKLGFGGPWGDGRQWWSWIHLEDEVGLILFALDSALRGALNATAPEPVTVNQFAEEMGRALHRPAALRAPEFAVRLALGEAADALFNLQRVVPKKALDAGYRFRYPSLSSALRAIFA
jgi:uncharacterized protein (TIGR01777 family)